MELRKCTQCGGDLKRIRTRREWLCPFCNARYTDEPAEIAKPRGKYHGLNEEVFLLEGDLSKIIKKEDVKGCINNIVHCMDTYETAAEVEEYIMRKCEIPDDISIKGVREEQITNAMPRISEVMEQGERVIVYGNKGILSKGKEYYVVTDKRCIFVDKKKVKQVLHTDIDTISLTEYANFIINGDYDKAFYNVSTKGILQGALIALIVMLSFEADNDREKIRIV